MSFLFFFLTGVTGLTLIIGLAKPTLFNKLFKGAATRAKIGKWFGSATGVFFVLFVIFVAMEGPKNNSTPVAETNQPANQEVADPENKPKETFTVSAVVDGDTLKVKSGADESTVRLLGIDSPELSGGGTECFAENSKQRLEELTKDKTVQLTVDESQGDKDKYDRLLRYVQLEDGTKVNEKMLYGGFAYEYTYDKPYEQQKIFKATESEAKNAKRGLWSPDTCNGQRQEPKQEAPVSNEPTSSEISAPASVYYANCTAARDAGAAPIYEGQPGYRSALDRNGDGVACE